MSRGLPLILLLVLGVAGTVAPAVATPSVLAAATPAAVDPDRDGLPTAFEVARTHTDPRRADTDRDGIRDGAEDPDGDGLSNAAEARYGDDPMVRDSDADGVSDWRDDRDGDGGADGLHQDRRPLPRDLRPSLAGAAADRPVSYRDGCHVGGGTVPVACTYGARRAPFSIVLFGDSHAAQWLPALIEIGTRRGWRVISITKSSCPAALVTVEKDGGPLRSCDAWRRAAFGVIDRIRPDILVISSLRAHDLWVDGHVLYRTATERIWRAGLLAALRRVRRAAGHVLVLGDTPHFRRSAVSCLHAHPRDIGACSERRSVATSQRRDALEASVAAQAGVSFAPAGPLVCPYDPCPVVIDHHLSWCSTTAT